MKLLTGRRLRLFLALMLLLVLSGLLLVPQVHWPVYGWLRREAFYQGMPSSWWVQQSEGYLEEHHVSLLAEVPTHWTVYKGAPSWWNQVQQHLNLATASDGAVPFSPLLNGDEAAFPVLLELLRSHSVKVRRVAVCGLSEQSEHKPEVIAWLQETIQDHDDAVREDAMAALQYVDPKRADKSAAAARLKREGP